MRRALLAAAIAFAGACAQNPKDEPGARIQDTTLTPRDTVNPNDTMPRIRDSMMDSAQ